MKANIDALLVHLAPDTGKKPHDNAFVFSKPINFGLLAIASYLDSLGYRVEIHDPRAFPAPDQSTSLVEHISTSNPRFIALSCISGFSYPTLNKISTIIKNAFPKKKVIVGGKDHVGVLPTVVLDECNAVDIVVQGEGEEVLRRLIDCVASSEDMSQVPNIAYRVNGKVHETNFTTDIYLDELPQTNFSLYPNYEEFPFSIEVSRGCYYSCDFCTENHAKLRKKSPCQIVDEVKLAAAVLGENNPRFYFEAPLFMYTQDELRELALLRSEGEVKFTWRAQTRVEYLASHSMELFAKAGLRVIDLGLESGSAVMLKRMGKTDTPADYLSKASKVLQTAWEAGILVKVNILLYIGESPGTIRETLRFLDAHSKYITALSAYPFLLYPGRREDGSILDDVRNCGGSQIQNEEWSARHIVPLNLSSRLTHDLSSKLARLISKSYQSFESFFTQKQYGYFSPGTTKAAVLEAVEQYGSEKLPFWITEEERQRALKQLMTLLAALD